MPIAVIHLLEGRDEAKKRALLLEVSNAISRTLDAPIESVRVIVQEMPNANFAIGGKIAKDLGR